MAFFITLTPGRGDTYGLRLVNGELTSVEASPTQVGRVLDAVLDAMRNSGHRAGILAAHQKTPVTLDEAQGVRLALVLLATKTLTKHDRIRTLVAGINAMSVEETYYWYSKCTGTSASNARRALRGLLSD